MDSAFGFKVPVMKPIMEEDLMINLPENITATIKAIPVPDLKGNNHSSYKSYPNPRFEDNHSSNIIQIINGEIILPDEYSFIHFGGFHEVW